MFKGNDQELSSVHIEFDTSIRNSRGHVKLVVLCISLELRQNLCWKYKLKDSKICLKS